jgi:hypothetical protein
MRITEQEEHHLRELYEKANESNDVQDWYNIRIYYKELGKKYGFDPRRVMINTRGEITKKSYQTIYVIYDSTTGVPVTAYYSKRDAMEHTYKEMSHHWEEVGLN